MRSIMRSEPAVLPGRRLVEAVDIVLLQRTRSRAHIVRGTVDGIGKRKAAVHESLLHESLKPVADDCGVPHVAVE